MKQTKKEIRGLTGLRGIASLWVLMYHVHEFSLTGVPSPLVRFIFHGHLATDIFFILSGFVMAMTYGNWFQLNVQLVSAYKIFILRRFARVYPLYFIMLVVILSSVIVGVSHSIELSGSMWMIFANFTMTQNWFFLPSINGPSWSISTEFMMYVLFPLLALSVLRSRLWIMLAALTLSFVSLTYFTVYSEDILYWPMLRCLTEFIIGLATYRIFMQYPAPMLKKNTVQGMLAVLLLLAAFFAPLDILIVFLIPPLLMVLAFNEGVVARFFSSRSVFFLGKISFSVYLLHSQFLRIRWLGERFLTPHLGDMLAAVVSLALLYISLLICATLTYKYIEKPARAWVRRWEPFIAPQANADTVPDNLLPSAIRRIPF